MLLEKIHLERFFECYQDIHAIPGLSSKLEYAWTGRPAADWCATVQKRLTSEVLQDFHALSKHPLSRLELRQLIERRSALSDPDQLLILVLEIFAWGGMSPRNGRLALNSRSAWLPVCRSAIEDSALDPVRTYELFYDLQHKRFMRGIGPAYYTKLIHFLCGDDGLILDQWTARSMNILSASGPVIKMHKAARNRRVVSPANNADTYLRYLKGVKVLRDKLTHHFGEHHSLGFVEALMFSLSPKRKSPDLSDVEFGKITAWRRYVMSL